MSVKISDNTSIGLPLRNLIGLIGAIVGLLFYINGLNLVEKNFFTSNLSGLMLVVIIAFIFSIPTEFKISGFFYFILYKGFYMPSQYIIYFNENTLAFRNLKLLPI